MFSKFRGLFSYISTNKIALINGANMYRKKKKYADIYLKFNPNINDSQHSQYSQYRFFFEI